MEVYFETFSNYVISVVTPLEQGEHREALVPGQFDRAREVLPDDKYHEVCELWTTEVVQKYKESLPLPQSEQELFNSTKLSKLQEIDLVCEKTIYEGIDIETSIGVKHFNLTAHDQSNITGITSTIGNPLLMQAAGIDPEQGIWYKADGEEETHHYWPFDDMLQLAAALFRFKTEQLTYCEYLKSYIKSLETIEELEHVTYGMKIPNIENA